LGAVKAVRNGRVHSVSMKLVERVQERGRGKRGSGGREGKRGIKRQERQERQERQGTSRSDIKPFSRSVFAAK
jgi:hypothetical protein